MATTNNKLPTPINGPAFINLLHTYYYDTILTEQLNRGFKLGFDLGYRGFPNSTLNVTNLKSARDNKHVVATALSKEVEAGRLLGPFPSPPFDLFQINPIGLIPKKESGTFRMIVHLSSPSGSSINDNIPEIFSKVSFQSLQDAIRLVVSCGKQAFMAKTDIKQAFRLIPVLPDQYKLLGIKWENNFFFDKCLPMGASSATQLFERVSSALHFLAGKRGVAKMVHYLDDFLIVHSSSSGCAADLTKFQALCSELNVPLAPDKTFGPSNTLTFLGIEIDTIKEEVRLPKDKLIKCKSAILAMLKQKKCTVAELDHITGLLNFTCIVIAPGRAFLKRLTNLRKGLHLPKPYFKLNLTKQVKEDLRLWLTFLHHFNGISLYRESMFLSSKTFNIYTDASKTLGFGALFGNHWFSHAWPNAWWASQNITLLELIPIYLAAKSWGHLLANSVVLFHTDSLDNVHSINNLKSEEELVMEYIRKIVLHALCTNFMFQAVHIKGSLNLNADDLSRLQVSSFRKRLPTADKLPTKVLPLPAYLPFTSTL